MGDSGGSDLSDSRSSERYSGLGIFEVEATEFSDGLDVRCERKRRVNDNLKVFGPRN